LLYNCQTNQGWWKQARKEEWWGFRG